MMEKPPYSQTGLTEDLIISNNKASWPQKVYNIVQSSHPLPTASGHTINHCAPSQLGIYFLHSIG